MSAPAKTPRMKYLPRNRKNNSGTATVNREAAICKLYGDIVLPSVIAIATWTVCVFGVTSVSAIKNSFHTCVKMMIATEA